MKKLTRMLIYLCLFGLTLGAFVYLGKKDYGTKISDAKKFSREYKISENNKFKYVKSYEVLDIIEHKSGVILMGFSNNEWMQYYVRYLNEAVNEDDIKTIYYYDLLEDRTRKNKNFVKIEDIMSKASEKFKNDLYVKEYYKTASENEARMQGLDPEEQPMMTGDSTAVASQTQSPLMNIPQHDESH